MVGTGCVVSYYCALMSLTVFYFFASFQSVLPWSVCDPAWPESSQSVCNKSLDANDADYYNSTNSSSKSISELYFE